VPKAGDAGKGMDGGADGGDATAYANGDVTVNLDTLLCEDITMAIVAPHSFVLGTPTPIAGSANNDAGDQFSMHWTSSAGRFEDDTAAQTTFTCTKLGVQTLTLLVGIGRSCSQALAAAFVCVEPRDGG